MKFFIIAIISIFIASSSFAQKKIVYCSDQTSSGLLQVFIMNEDGSNKTQVTNVPYNCIYPRFSPDGKQIVFSTRPGHMYLVRNIDTDIMQLPYYLWGGYYPVFSPDGNQVIFNNEYDDILSVLILDTTGGAEPYLISDGNYANMHRLSPQGDKLVFSQMYDGSKTVLVADLNDTTDNFISRVSINSNANIEPDISVDGKYAYASFDNNLNGTILLYDNGKEIPLTKDLVSSNTPRFSPNGKRIAFVAIAGETVKLYTMNTDGSGKKNWSIGGNAGVFRWMDDDRIVFNTETSSSSQIGILNVSTGDIKTIASGGTNIHPDFN